MRAFASLAFLLVFALLAPGAALAQDADGDGLTDAEEAILGTNPANPDSDGDRVWDGEEVEMYLTNPLAPDTDGDAYDDRADPEPNAANAPIDGEYSVFTDNATGTARTALTVTAHLENHVVYLPAASPAAPRFLYQRYLRDVNDDNAFDEGDLLASAIGIMNADGSRPRLLTDVNAQGEVEDNGAIDAVPSPSPDGAYVLFASDRGGGFQTDLRLWVMDIDGGNPRMVAFLDGDGAPLPFQEIDADPFWGPGNRVAFKRHVLGIPSFSRLYVGDLDPVAATVTNLTLRTDGPPRSLQGTPAGDYDPWISPDGQWIASYRKVSDAITVQSFGETVLLGDFDLWVGALSDPSQPGAASIALLDASDRVADNMPRWDATGTRLALWSFDLDALLAAEDFFDVHVLTLGLTSPPALDVQVLSRVNITHLAAVPGAYWNETMPAWNPDLAHADELVYSGERWFCLDADADGFSTDTGHPVECAPYDCDDGNYDVKPSAQEVCNGVDDNCDGVVDEGCPPGGGCAIARGAPVDGAALAAYVACFGMIAFGLGRRGSGR